MRKRPLSPQARAARTPSPARRFRYTEERVESQQPRQALAALRVRQPEQQAERSRHPPLQPEQVLDEDEWTADVKDAAESGPLARMPPELRDMLVRTLLLESNDPQGAVDLCTAGGSALYSICTAPGAFPLPVVDRRALRQRGVRRGVRVSLLEFARIARAAGSATDAYRIHDFIETCLLRAMLDLATWGLLPVEPRETTQWPALLALLRLWAYQSPARTDLDVLVDEMRRYPLLAAWRAGGTVPLVGAYVMPIGDAPEVPSRVQAIEHMPRLLAVDDVPALVRVFGLSDEAARACFAEPVEGLAQEPDEEGEEGEEGEEEEEEEYEEERYTAQRRRTERARMQACIAANMAYLHSGHAKRAAEDAVEMALIQQQRYLGRLQTTGSAAASACADVLRNVPLFDVVPMDLYLLWWPELAVGYLAGEPHAPQRPFFIPS